ncbi:leucine-rich repeat-containing protein 74B-like isoform X1 [Octopus sinensis]|uniref:Leucine-rich repeat-containing protein 74B-like isoform X1 n=1 Tax=Octopus sinensis TaxID=2607531 RepID=A0A6P7SYY9_9MOLL|nr:leucine-rich repeat-containing protein 74B-like isoform X1 [Octopus sinensis]
MANFTMALETVVEEHDDGQSSPPTLNLASPSLDSLHIHQSSLNIASTEPPPFLLTEIHDYEEEKNRNSVEEEQIPHSSVVVEEPTNESEDNTTYLEPGEDKDSENTFEADYDIEEHWDIDQEEEPLSHDVTGKSMYLDLCQEMGIHPVSSFLRHIRQDQIALPHYGLGPDAVKPISIVLRHSITLEKLDLTENLIDGEGTQFISKMLEENDFITDLNLSNNQVGPAGITHIAKMLCCNKGLRSLNLSGNRLEDSVLEQLMNALEKNKYLESIDLSKNRLGENGGEIFGVAIGSNEYLQQFDLSWNYIRLRGAVAIGKGLRDNVRLKRCNLAFNGFGIEGGFEIAEALIHNTTLQELNLTANRLTDSCIEKIAKSLLVNETLQILQLGKNPISTTGAISLVNAINNNDNTGLNLLDLTDVSVEYEFLRIVFDIKQKKNFKAIFGHILRSGNTTEDIGKKAIEVDSRNQYKKSLLILKQSVVVRDPALMETLKKYDTEGNFTITPEDFIAAVKECALEIDTKDLMQTLKAIAKKGSGKIYFGDLATEAHKD